MSTLYYRIGTSSATLENGNFFLRGLPPPTNAIYNNHTTRRPQGGGGEGRHGHNNAEMLWRFLTAEQAFVLYDMINTAESTGGQGNGTIWLTLPKTDGEHSGMAWLDISGIGIMPQWSPVENGDGIGYENVVLRVNDCTEQNVPSTALT